MQDNYLNKNILKVYRGTVLGYKRSIISWDGLNQCRYIRQKYKREYYCPGKLRDIHPPNPDIYEFVGEMDEEEFEEFKDTLLILEDS